MAALFEPWLQYQHPLVRQLAFAIASPNILTSTPAYLSSAFRYTWMDDVTWRDLYYLYESRLTELNTQPEELIRFMAQLKSTRLGLRFEYLMWFWLQDPANQAYELIAHSIQIIDGKHTLGELDFLVKNKSTQNIEHWEVALKFYLGECNIEIQHWYGLNRTDTLFRKLTHFGEKQFQFSNALNYPIERKIAVMKGQLYLPFRPECPSTLPFSQLNGTDAAHQPLPEWINPARKIGLWGKQLPAVNGTEEFYRLDRHEWICPNQSPHDLHPHWWTNGLYYSNISQVFYMLRQELH